MASDYSDTLLDFLADNMPAAYRGADTVLLCGSTARGTATARSDLDLVVLFDRLPEGARRETLAVGQALIEAFIHDIPTLDYFLEMDASAETPVLASMVAEGVPVPGFPSRLLEPARGMANGILAAGPPPYDIDRHRYTISSLADDLHEGLSPHECLAIGTELYSNLGNFALRAAGCFGGRGKNLARALEQHEPALAGMLETGLPDLLTTGRMEGVQEAVDSFLAPYGGRLIAGYRASAPREWRRERS